MIIQSTNGRIEWKANRRDSDFINFPTFENLITGHSSLTQTLMCPNVPQTVAKGIKRGASEITSAVVFRMNLDVVLNAIKEEQEQLFVRYQLYHSERLNDHCSLKNTNGYTIINGSIWGHLEARTCTNDKKLIRLEDVRSSDNFYSEQWGEIIVKRKKIKTNIIDQLEKIKQLLPEKGELKLIPNPRSDQKKDAELISSK